MTMKQTMLVITDSLHKKVKKHLLPGDGLEAAAVIFCHSGTGQKCHRLIAHEVFLVPYSDSKRKSHVLKWNFAKCFSPDKITEIDKRGLSIITIHSHPDGEDDFSITDDRNDEEIFPSINNWFDDNRPNGSAVMLPDGSIFARIVDAKGKFHTMDSVASLGDNIQIWKNLKPSKKTDYGQKIAQVFGGKTLDLLRSMRVGVVGCSGTGSIITELLARNCVGNLVVVDNDYMEPKNLNRIINGTMTDARKKQSKVSVIKNAVKRMGMGTRVEPYQSLSDSPDVVRALVDCDVIFGCVDSHFGRYHLDCIASAYHIPYFDVGVGLIADGKGGIEAADAVSHYMHPEGQDLFSRGGYTMEQVTAENYKRNDPERYKERKIADYLATVGEEQPAVMSVNMQAACLAFNDFMARIHPYRMDDNQEFAVQRFRIAHGHYMQNAADKQQSKLFEKWAGTGDNSILVKNNICHD